MGRLILHVLPLDLARGAQRYARELRRRLDSEAVQHRILTLFASPSRELAADIALDIPRRTAQRFGVDPRAALGLLRELRRLQPDLVVAHGSEPLKYLALTGRSVPRVIYYKIGVAQSSVLRGPRRLVHHALMGRAARVAGVSQECLDEAERSFGVPRAQLVLIPNGRDEAKFFPEPRPVRELPSLVFVGHLTSSKRPERFIEVVRLLRQQRVPLTASMIGDGPLRATLSERAAAAGVDLLGHSDRVAELLRQSDVAAFTSIPDGEGMPGVFIEAGLSGVPMVSTAVPGASTVIQDGQTGFVVGVEDLAGFVEKTRLLLTDPALRQHFGDAARARCLEGFTLDASAAKWQALLGDMLSGSAPA